MLQAEFFIKIDPFSDIKAMPHLQACFMKPAHHIHADLHIIPVICTGIAGIFIVFRDLITGLRVQIQHMFCNAQRTDGIINFFFLLSVNKKLCARSGDTADTVMISGAEQEGFIGHAGF